MSIETKCQEGTDSPTLPMSSPPDLNIGLKPQPIEVLVPVAKEEKSNLPKHLRKRELSPEMRQLLEEEIIEAEIQTAIDAASEEGYSVTREQAIKILLEQDLKEDSITSG